LKRLSLIQTRRNTFVKVNEDPLETERLFFTSLVEGDRQMLDEIIADDFLLIDVMSGSEITKEELLAVLASGQLRFEAIHSISARVRLYHTTAVITGSTHMRGWFEATPFEARSRYTHVFVELSPGQWKMVSAQGTQIAPTPELPETRTAVM
jgi:hypothetical protein